MFTFFLGALQTCNEAALRSQTHLANCLGDNPNGEILLKTAALSIGAWKDWPEYFKQVVAYRNEMINNFNTASNFENVSSNLVAGIADKSTKCQSYIKANEESIQKDLDTLRQNIRRKSYINTYFPTCI